MILSKLDLKEYITEELKNFKYPILAHLPFDLFEQQIIAKYLLLLRKTEYFVNNNSPLKFLYLIMLKRKQNKYGLHIPINTCKKGLSISHLGSIIINCKAKIGENLRIHIGVVIGDSRGVPNIGNNVYIGPGAKIFGDIVIADNVKIGANAVVNKSCSEPGATLVGVPSRIISKNQ